MKCILHIGTEKTGTTLLQDWLYDNRDTLSAIGIGLTTAAGHPNNRRLAAYFTSRFDDFHRAHSLSTQAERDTFFRDFEADLAAELSALSRDHHTVVFSSEHLHSRLAQPSDIARLRDFLAAQFAEIRVICYFREQSQLRKSLFSTALRAGRTAPFADFNMPLEPGHHYYDYDLFFGKWADAFGAERLDPVLYDRASFRDGDIRKDFITRVLPGIDLDRLSYRISSANEAFGALHAEAARAVNIAQPQYLADQPNTLRRNLVRAVLGVGALDTGPIADPDAGAIHDAFDASNRRFAARFLGRDDNPFKRPSTPGDTAPRSYSEAEVAAILHQTLVTVLSLPGLVQLGPAEINGLAALAGRLRDKGLAGEGEIRTLLRLLHRAAPESASRQT